MGSSLTLRSRCEEGRFRLAECWRQPNTQQLNIQIPATAKRMIGRLAKWKTVEVPLGPHVPKTQICPEVGKLTHYQKRRCRSDGATERLWQVLLSGSCYSSRLAAFSDDKQMLFGGSPK